MEWRFQGEEDMFVELELVDGVSFGGINFFITLPPLKGFKKSHRKADILSLVKFLFHLYLPKGFKELPFYFKRFEADIDEMPEFDDPPEKNGKIPEVHERSLFLEGPISEINARVPCIWFM